MKKLKAVSLFSSAGIGELGLKQKGNLYELGKKIYTGTELRRIV